MSNQAFLSDLATILEVPSDQLVDEMPLQGGKLDSMTLLEVAIIVDRHYHVTPVPQELWACRTLGELQCCIDRAVAAAEAAHRVAERRPHNGGKRRKKRGKEWRPCEQPRGFHRIGGCRGSACEPLRPGQSELALPCSDARDRIRRPPNGGPGTGRGRPRTGLCHTPYCLLRSFKT